MTKLGSFLEKKSINKSEVSRKTGISKARISLLCNNSKTKLTVTELYLIALAIDVDANDMLIHICNDITLTTVTKKD